MGSRGLALDALTLWHDLYPYSDYTASCVVRIHAGHPSTAKSV